MCVGLLNGMVQYKDNPIWLLSSLISCLISHKHTLVATFFLSIIPTFSVCFIQELQLLLNGGVSLAERLSSYH